MSKGQLNSEWIYDVIVSPKMLTKNLMDFWPGSLLEGRAEILQIFGWYFERNDDVINSEHKFILNLTDLYHTRRKSMYKFEQKFWFIFLVYCSFFFRNSSFKTFPYSCILKIFKFFLFQIVLIFQSSFHY